LAELCELPVKEEIKPEVSTKVISGRDRIARNVLASWGGYMIIIVSGFLIPRMIDSHLGQTVLGVWDFSWSIVAYFGLVQVGIISSINRYVAKYRAIDDLEGINCVVSSVTVVLFIIAGVVFLLTVGTTLTLPYFMGRQLNTHLVDGQWVVFFLGLNLAINLAFSGFGGLITGFHRWDLYNGIQACSYALVTVGMIVILLLGGGLRSLALANLLGDAGTLAIRSIIAAYYICPGLQVRPKFFRWTMARQMLGFGGKTFIPTLGDLLLNQTTSILIMVYLGPVVLATYSRSRSLVRHIITFLNKFAFVMVPTASSLKVMKQEVELRNFFIEISRYSSYIAFPPILVLTILGGPLLHLWMGANYDKGTVLAILAIGNLSFAVQQSVISILSGMNMHGRPGIANFLAAVCSALLSILALGPLKLGLIGVALAVTIPITIVNSTYIPMYACRQFKISFFKYLKAALLMPLLLNIPFAICLVISTVVFSHKPFVSLICGLITGGTILIITYWQYVLPKVIKQKIISIIYMKTTVPVGDIGYIKK
jgi:O-antigen/teichoic acid export membrane protein